MHAAEQAQVLDGFLTPPAFFKRTISASQSCGARCMFWRSLTEELGAGARDCSAAALGALKPTALPAA
ncbi:MAG: hypothetical protein IPH43_10235 [Xanthomonadales bacterium]|nr:hypothetical protein [Xanthomonadales bacterium]